MGVVLVLLLRASRVVTGVVMVLLLATTVGNRVLLALVDGRDIAQAGVMSMLYIVCIQ